MAEQLYFSRDTRLIIQFRNTTDNTETAASLGLGDLWEVPILDGYSFSQTTNTSEITLAEMESSAGVSRRGRRMFTDSLAPAEWSFSTYIRPFKSKAGSPTPSGTRSSDSAAEVHAVEEVLWASMFGADTYASYKFTRATNAVSGPVVTPATAGSDPLVSTIVATESNRAALHGMTLWFWIDTATSNPLIYRLPEAVVNEVSIDFDVDGIATLNWTGFAKEVMDWSGKTHVDATTPVGTDVTLDGDEIDVGDVWINTGNAQGRVFEIVKVDPGNSNACTTTQAIDEGTTSTKNFIRNRLTSVDIEASDAADKISTIFPGSYATISAIDTTNEVVTTSTAHNLTTGDQVYITGCTGNTDLNGTHHFVRVGDETGTYGGTTNTTTEFALFGTKAQAENLGNATGLVAIGSGSYNANTGTVANGKYGLTLTGGSFNIANNITYLVPEELGAINKPLEHVTGTRTSTGNATCYLTLEDSDLTSGTSRQFFNDLVSTGAMSKVVNKFKVTMHIGGSSATGNATDPALKVEFPTAHIEVPTHQVEDVISMETNFQALPTDFGTANEITAITYYPVDDYA
tara:strand:- start:14323 stop:16041 length:1719 start_codon:yes stop_codon:yes gene_type:complete